MPWAVHSLHNTQDPLDGSTLYSTTLDQAIMKESECSTMERKWQVTHINNLDHGLFLAGDGRVVVGRLHTDNDHKYSSVEVDELI